MNYDVLVVGSGPAGLAAAVAARGRDKSVLVVGNPWQESPLARAERIDNYLGLPGVNGRELMEHFSAHAQRVGVEFHTGRVVAVMAWEGFALTAGSEVFPARFMLVCAMNPCKCGWHGYSDRCRCSPGEVERYLGRLSGPLLDRIDLYVDVPPLEYEELSRRGQAESSAAIRRRVNAARAIQTARFGPDGPDCNARMGPPELLACCALDEDCRAVMKGAYERMGLTARSHDRILRVARTIADLEGGGPIQVSHLAEAIQYRASGYLQR